MDFSKLEYYVIRYNINNNTIEKYNIFNNTKICNNLEKELKSFFTYEDFKEKLDNLLKWAFLSKSEYEVMISDIFNKIKPVKVDIYYQLKDNIDIIANMIIDYYNKEVD